MMHVHASRSRRGFTLIELLVVVSIIALLISILLPSLQAAREQAKLTVCQANLSSIGKVLMTYLLDLNALPIYTTQDANGNTIGWATWTSGGWSGKNRAQWEAAGPHANVQTSERPLTVYALAGGSIADQEDIVPDDWVGGAETFPTEEAPMFKCPSDNRNSTWTIPSEPGGDTQMSSYDNVGTSYPLNWAWWPQTHPVLNNIPNDVDEWSFRANLGVQIWLRQMNRHGSRFISMLEDPAEFGINAGWSVQGTPCAGTGGQQVMGYHNRFSRHVALYLDGHVAYRFMDTRHNHDSKPNPPGPRHTMDTAVGSWTTVDETFGPCGHASSGRHK